MKCELLADILCSYFHFLPRGHDSVASFARDEQWGFKHIIDNQNQFLMLVDMLDGLKHPYAKVYYEDLIENTLFEVSKLVQFLGMMLNTAQLQQVVESASFSSMRKREMNGELLTFGHKKGAQKLKSAAALGLNASQMFGIMTRRGEAGGWRSELDKPTKEYVNELMK